MFLSNNDENIYDDDTLLKITQINSNTQIKLEEIKLEQIKLEQIKIDAQIKLEQIKYDTQIKVEQIKYDTQINNNQQIKYEDCMKYEQNFNYCYNLFK